MPGNSDALRNVASQYQAIHNLVTGALHVSEQSAAAHVGWTGLAADDYDTMRAGRGRFSNGTLLGGQALEKYLDQQLASGTLAIQHAQSAETVMAELALILEQSVGWFNTQAHLVDESNSFLHSVLFQILIAVVAVIVAIAAAYVAPFVLAGLSGVAGLIGDAAVSALSIAARGVTTVIADTGAGAATEVAAGAAADAGATTAVDTGAGAATEVAAGAAADAGTATAADTGAGAATGPAVSPGAATATDTGAGAAAPAADTGAGAAAPAADTGTGVTTGPAVSPGAATVADTGAGAAGPAADTGAGVTTGPAVSPGAATATDTGAGAAAPTVDTGASVAPAVDTGASVAPAVDTGASVAPAVDTGAAAPAADTGAGAASVDTGAAAPAADTGTAAPAADTGAGAASESSGPAGSNTASGGAATPRAPLENFSANGSADNTAAGSRPVSSEIQPAPAAAEPGNGGAGAAARGPSLSSKAPGLILPSRQEIAHGLAMVVTQSGTDTAGQTLVQMVNSAIEHHGQFWKLSKNQGLFIAGSALGIPLAQAFNLTLRSAPLLGRTLVDGALNSKLPAGWKLPSSLAGKPGINIWFTYGNAGVAAYGLDQQFTHQKFSVVAALISYGGYGVLAASDAALGKVLPGLFSRTGQGRADGQPSWVNEPPLAPGKYANGKVPVGPRPIGVQGPLNAAGHYVPPMLGGRGTGGQTGRVSVGPAGHGWSPDPRPYLQQTIPKIANRLWYYSLDHQLVYDNGHLPGVHDGNDHYYFVLPTMHPQSPPMVGPVGAGPAGTVTQPVAGSVPSVPSPPAASGGGQSSSPGHPAPRPRPGPHPAPLPTPTEVTASYAQDQAVLQAAQTALNQQIGQIQQLRGTLRQLPRTPQTHGVEEELTALQTTIAAQQDEITRTQQLIGQLQSHSASQKSILLVGPATVAVQQHLDEVNSREDTISSLLARDIATVDAARRSTRNLPPVPVVSR